MNELKYNNAEELQEDIDKGISANLILNGAANYTIGYKVAANGQLVEDETSLVSAKIPCKYGDQIDLVSPYSYICVYDANDVKLDDWSARTRFYVNSSKVGNASYLIASFLISNIGTAKISVNSKEMWTPSKTEGLSGRVDREFVVVNSAMNLSVCANKFDYKDKENVLAKDGIGYILNINGSITHQSGVTYSVTHYIDVSGAKKVFFRCKENSLIHPAYRVVTFDEDKNSISHFENVTDIVITDDVKYVRICDTLGIISDKYSVSIDAPLQFYEPYIVLPSDVKRKNWDIVMPSSIRVSEGVECNILTINITRNFEPKDCKMVEMSGFKNVYEAYRLTPSNTESFDSFIRVYADNLRYTTMAKGLRVLPIAASSGSGKTLNVLIIGDSLTARNVYTKKIVDMFDADSMNINMIGTRGDSPKNRHEGHGGWRAYTYTRCASEEDDPHTSGSAINPFWHDGAFDFSYYMSSNGFEDVDAVIINLGINDVDAKDTNEDILTYYEEMIDSIKAYKSSVIIGLGLCPTGAICGNYPKKRDKDKFLRVVELLIDNYDNKESENIYLIPTHTCVDPDYDYDTQEVSISASNSLFKHRIVTDYIHPAEAGYSKIAFAIFPYLKYWGSLI